MNTLLKRIINGSLRRTRKRMYEVVEAFWKTAKTLRNEDGVMKSKYTLFFDMMWCMLRYGTDQYNYRNLKYYNLNGYGRNQYLSNLRNQRLMLKFNINDTLKLFLNKAVFYQQFAPFVHHEWKLIAPHSKNNYLNTDEIYSFIEKHKSVIIKPVDSALGSGVYKLNFIDKKGIEVLINDVKCGQAFLMEEVVLNHPVIKAFHPSSLNTIRMVTCIDKKGIFHIVSSLIRIGSGDAVIDNAKGGGMMCHIYPENGIICGDAYDMYGHRYERHPDSGILFVGYQIPRWNKVLEYTEKLARHIPDARYVGWDIVITEDGLDVLEGNIPAGENITQMARGEGVWNELKSYL